MYHEVGVADTADCLRSRVAFREEAGENLGLEAPRPLHLRGVPQKCFVNREQRSTFHLSKGMSSTSKLNC